jgi:hypothetical protein
MVRNLRGAVDWLSLLVTLAKASAELEGFVTSDQIFKESKGCAAVRSLHLLCGVRLG